jgi:hypothetical protein
MRAALLSRLRLAVAPRQLVADVAQIDFGNRALGLMGRQPVHLGFAFRREPAKLGTREKHQFNDRQHTHSVLHLSRPRQSRPSEGGPCAGGGGCTACGGNGVDERMALAAIKPTSGAIRPEEKDAFGADRMKEAGAGSRELQPMDRPSAVVILAETLPLFGSNTWPRPAGAAPGKSRHYQVVY